MTNREKVIKGLECCILRNPDDHARCSQCPYGGNCVNRLKMDALELLKGQEESIPVSWLKEKLEGHPELSYAITDGISNVLDLWEGR